jgi:uncharacterized damage-inducible protein DinB
MTDAAAFASWVEPIAMRYRESGAAAVALARSLRGDELTRPTGDAGWSVREELAHMAASEADFVATLGAVVRDETVDASTFADIDSRNARNLAARSERSPAEIAAELEQESAELNRLLTQLKAEDAARTPDGMPFSLEQLLTGYSMHSPYHLGQIRAALDSPARQADKS